MDIFLKQLQSQLTLKVQLQLQLQSNLQSYMSFKITITNEFFGERRPQGLPMQSSSPHWSYGGSVNSDAAPFDDGLVVSVVGSKWDVGS
jgi:hypothetical protein